jgi:hypothetical protein
VNVPLLLFPPQQCSILTIELRAGWPAPVAGVAKVTEEPGRINWNGITVPGALASLS